MNFDDFRGASEFEMDNWSSDSQMSYQEAFDLLLKDHCEEWRGAVEEIIFNDWKAFELRWDSSLHKINVRDMTSEMDDWVNDE